ncbi:S8 family serine peptidase [Dactylosporangium sp. CA-092794]|uniref:S8 family serine peptidase n=1 Tax=Dactylosporangium sp. CA-092794 TaxID=3239929 RepID=UPI003D8DAAD9
MSSRRWLVPALGSLLALPAALLVPTSAHAAPATCSNAQGRAGETVQEVPWQQRWLDPERVWPFTTGAGQVVAVIDSGVDGNHSQLRGHVLPGFDLESGHPDNNLDCIGHGTSVASIIAAQASDLVGFKGLAPGATILPVRLGDSDPAATPDSGNAPSTAIVASAVAWAAAHGATVIDVSSALAYDDPLLRSAVQQAQAAGVVVVAAVGDHHDANHLVDPPTFPAAYPGVIGVGAINSSFDRASSSQVGDYVDLMAPGDQVLAAARIAGLQTLSGTSVAAAVVSGTVALLRAAAPTLTPQQVAERLAATADPSPGGQRGLAYGRGIVDPYRAVTERRWPGEPSAIPGVASPVPDQAGIARNQWWNSAGDTALAVAGVATGAAALLAAVLGVLPAGRRRRWRTGMAPAPVDPVVDNVLDHDDLFALKASRLDQRNTTIGS